MAYVEHVSSCFVLFFFFFFLFVLPPVVVSSHFLYSFSLPSPLSCLHYSEEDGEQEDKTIWYYSTKVNVTRHVLLLGAVCSSRN